VDFPLGSANFTNHQTKLKQTQKGDAKKEILPCITFLIELSPIYDVQKF
jgi:hypothetical protein